MACGNNAHVDDLPPRESIYVNDHWRVAHSFDTTLPGWLVVIARTHATALHQMPPAAAITLGPLLHRLSTILVDVFGCTKAYLMFFAEGDGFEHLHIHVVPRMPDFPHEVQGPRVFAHLKHPQDEWIPDDEQDRISLKIRERLQLED